MIRKLMSLLLISGFLFSTYLAAEQSEDFGGYTVHYVAVNSNFLNPAIASQYDLVRGNRNAFLNISVLKNSEAKPLRSPAVSASISGFKKNLLGQSEIISFKEIREGDAIYYIGQFEFSNAERLSFELEIQPESTGPSYSLQWNAQLYIN